MSEKRRSSLNEIENVFAKLREPIFRNPFEELANRPSGIGLRDFGSIFDAPRPPPENVRSEPQPEWPKAMPRNYVPPLSRREELARAFEFTAQILKQERDQISKRELYRRLKAMPGWTGRITYNCFYLTIWEDARDNAGLLRKKRAGRLPLL
jgi:hypothetical protein